MAIQRRTLTGSTLVILGVLFVAVVLLSNVLLRGARVDLTQNNLYTLSDGTRNVLTKLDEPIHLYLYYSDKATQNLPMLRTYYQRVRELLEEMAARADGKLQLTVIDPLPFSEDEDTAASYGLQAVPISQAGEKAYFGLAGTNSTDGVAIIPFFNPDKETFLEYDVAKLIHDLTTTKKPAVGFISSLSMAAGFNPETRQMKEPWAAYQELSQLFDVRQLNAAALKSIDKDINVVVLVHPKDLPEDALYALDQFVLRGGHLMVFVDPHAEQDESGADPQNPQSAMLADKSSDLGTLFKAWGVEYAPDKVLLDRTHALQVSFAPNTPPTRHPAMLGFTKQNLSPDDVITANLDTVNISTAGYFELSKDATAKLVPIIQSSNQSMSTPVDQIKFMADPSALMSNFKPTGSLFVVAGRLEGTFKTAFPDRKEEGHLAQSKDSNAILLFADTDVLSDRLWAQVNNFFGQKMVNAFANNGDLFINAVDNLSGDSDLISIRGRATSRRPFTKVEEIKRSADDRFRSKEQELQQELSETERKLTQLQTAKGQDQAMVLSSEQKIELDKFLKRKVEVRKELREVRRKLDEDIEKLGTRLKVFNILLIPIVLTIGALAFAAWRRKRPQVA
ncbi:Gldg family protein [Tahibacter amnicola]|uniref:Gldg family protein n=1 Tax=Tahibacter amnicola TaxID=2976241 RepID=A0ABY6BKM2_9GAMM|nr:Gldg family protein [Tahibacter amnicola]UXI69590.1 Gldg family protein [Tahibacter amnicola]